MKKQLKLTCPMCKTKFVTNHPNKIWCNKACGNKYSEVKQNIKINKSRQDTFIDSRFTYDFDSDKFYITSLMPENLKP